MLKPTNSAAEQISALLSVNNDIDIQIATLRATQEKNLETVKAFEEIATWEEVAEEVVAEEEAIEEVVVEEEPTLIPWEELEEGHPALEDFLAQEAANSSKKPTRSAPKKKK